MTVMQIIILISAGLVALLITHFLALRIGWNMGIKSDPNMIASKPSKDRPVKSQYTDPFSSEYLDFE